MRHLKACRELERVLVRPRLDKHIQQIVEVALALAPAALDAEVSHHQRQGILGLAGVLHLGIRITPLCCSLRLLKLMLLLLNLMMLLLLLLLLLLLNVPSSIEPCPPRNVDTPHPQTIAGLKHAH
jgi:hypothetical protein